MTELRIGEHQIGEGHRPFIIAEMSGNHNQSLEQALAIVEAAARAGVQAVKIQTYTPDTMTLDVSRGEFFISDQDSPWKGQSLHQLYQQAFTPWEWHEAIFDRCKKLKIMGFSSPFDKTAVDFLEKLAVPCYKIASFENTDLPLIRKVAATGKPMIISTGMATVAELAETVRAARESGCSQLILLKCTSSYPARAADSNLRTIPHMRQLFHCEVGLSDHTLGIGTALGAVAMGATVIEKHVTLKRAAGGVDAAFSLEPRELKALVKETEVVRRSLGIVQYGLTESEQESVKFRRSIYIAQDMEAGERFTEENLRVIRPGLGLAPKFYELLLGRSVKLAVKKGTPATWDVIN